MVLVQQGINFKRAGGGKPTIYHIQPPPPQSTPLFLLVNAFNIYSLDGLPLSSKYKISSFRVGIQMWTTTFVGGLFIQDLFFIKVHHLVWVLPWESIADISKKVKQLDELQTQKEMLELWWREICLKFSFISFHHKYKRIDTMSCGVSKYYL